MRIIGLYVPIPLLVILFWCFVALAQFCWRHRVVLPGYFKMYGTVLWGVLFGWIEDRKWQKEFAKLADRQLLCARVEETRRELEKIDPFYADSEYVDPYVAISRDYMEKILRSCESGASIPRCDGLGLAIMKDGSKINNTLLGSICVITHAVKEFHS